MLSRYQLDSYNPAFDCMFGNDYVTLKGAMFVACQRPEIPAVIRSLRTGKVIWKNTSAKKAGL